MKAAGTLCGRLRSRSPRRTARSVVLSRARRRDAVRLLAMAAVSRRRPPCAAAARLTPVVVRRLPSADRHGDRPARILAIVVGAVRRRLLRGGRTSCFRSSKRSMRRGRCRRTCRRRDAALRAWDRSSASSSRGSSASTQGHAAPRCLGQARRSRLLGGVAPLLMPNPYLPDAVRWAHFVETSVSNLVFGALAGWILQGESSTRRGGYERGRTPIRLTGTAGASSRPGTSID